MGRKAWLTYSDETGFFGKAAAPDTIEQTKPAIFTTPPGSEKDLHLLGGCAILTTEKPLIKSGGGTGPVKPGNRTISQGANSR